MTVRLLLVDDDPLDARQIQAGLSRPDRIQVDLVSCAEALERLSIAPAPWDAVLSDIGLSPMSGIDLVREIRSRGLTIPVYLMAAEGSITSAVDGMRTGATDFLVKPLDADAAALMIERAIRGKGERARAPEQDDRPNGPRGESLIVGAHPRLQAVRAFASRVAPLPDLRVLITGESGTGKNLLARAIHALGGTPGPYLEVNCAALQGPLLEAELFGHEPGGIPGAEGSKPGLFETARGGTVLLNEIGSMSLELQPRLLGFLENREFRRAGGTATLTGSARVIAATSEDLEEAVREGRFRADLLYRLDVLSIRMPTLRAMPAVIPELAARFLRDICRRLGRPVPEISAGCLAGLQSYPWPGNMRQLWNIVERAVLFHDAGELAIHAPKMRAGIDGPDGPALPAGMTLDQLERAYLAAELAARRGDLAGIASSLGISQKTLLEKRKKHGL
jgi:DNA-binding NtrC family response regulator